MAAPELVLPPKPNGLISTMKFVVEANLKDPKKAEAASKMNLVASVETDYNTTATLRFRDGKIIFENGAASDAEVHMKGDFATLAKVTAREMHPLRAMLTGKIRVSGSKWKGMKLQKLTILPKEMARDRKRKTKS
ncbi:MAG: SCP2 sterol-binding domain-containing protein [Halobacteria archaeon]